jgi:uncharacterized protein YhbP (UPF0306 family)
MLDHETIHYFLESHSTMALATSGANGYPQVTPLFFVADDRLHLYWLSSPGSRHSLNVAERPRAAATVYPDVWDWKAIRGVQVEGLVSIIHDSEVRTPILARYRTKFPLPAMFDAQIAGNLLYMLRPIWMRWVDNSVRFGHREETTWEV